MRLCQSALVLFLSSGLFVALTGCGGGGGGGETSPPSTGGGTVDLNTLSGLVRTSGGDPLPGVTVHAATASAVTDATGAFILSSLGSLPVGSVVVEFDGRTAVPTGALPFPVLDVIVPLPAGTTALTMPQVITLPDLNNAVSANQSLALNADGSAVTPIDVVQAGGMTDMSLSGPTGTLVTIAGAVGGAGVDLNMTPVDPGEVPMPLPDGLQGNGFVTIQPGNASFDPPDPTPPGDPVLGLDIVMPDLLGLPVGTLVDIWSFDHDAAEWVNRTLETGQSGVVQLAGGVGPGTEVVATGVITEGGWHSPVVPVDPDCGTRVMGSVVDLASGAGIAGAAIAFANGQFATTADDGTFLSDLVPAYDVATLMGSGECIPAEICYEVVLPPGAGGLTSGKLTLPAMDVVPGGVTVLSSVGFNLGTTGTLAGVVLGQGASGEMVRLMPDVGSARSVQPNASGAFFATGLEEGGWTASYLFEGDAAATSVPFAITANTTTTIAIQAAKGGGSDDIVVLVLRDDGDNGSAPAPVAGATVRLVGTDGVSAGGLVMLTDQDGKASFTDVTGPYTVTAQKDVFEQAVNTRYGSSLVGVAPASGTIGVLLGIDDVPGAVVMNATLGGTILNLPPLSANELIFVSVSITGTQGQGFVGATFADPMTGAYALPIPGDVLLDINVTRRDATATSQVLSTLRASGVGPVAVAGMLTVDLDHASAVLWSEPVDFTFGAVEPGATVLVHARITDTVTGSSFFESVYFGPSSTSNVTLNLPDVAAPAFAGLRFVIEGVAVGVLGNGFQSCGEALTSTPGALVLSFLGVPNLTSPMPGAVFTVAEMEALHVIYSGAGGGAFGGSGVDLFFLSYEPGGSGTPPAGVQAMEWDVIVRSGTGSFDLPLTALPMFGPGQDGIVAELEALRFEGPVFDYDAFFNEDLAANLDALLNGDTARCEASVEQMLSTQ